MSVAAITYLLAASANLIAVVPAARIMAGVLPLNTEVPALGVTQISGLEATTVAMNQAASGRLRTERVQVTINAETYPQQKQILELVRAACRNRHGLTNGVDLDSILPGGDGPDGFDAAAKNYAQTIDFIVRWRTT